jgi:K+-sensing histidine kinase KdpD
MDNLRENSLRTKLLVRRLYSSRPFRLAVGLAVALIASWAVAQGFAGTPTRTAVPLWFIAVLYLLARRYGMGVAVVGSLMCAGIFAHFLFNPTGSLEVEDTSARTILLWMVVGSIVISYLLAPSREEPKGS